MSLEGNYINRVYKKHEKTDEDAFVALSRLQEPLNLLEGEGEAVQTYEFGEGAVSLATESITEADKAKIHNYVIDLTQRRSGFIETLDYGNWSVVTEVKITLEDRELDLYNLLPDGYKIYNYSFEGYDRTMGTIQYDTKSVFVIGPLNTIRGLSVLLHEIGHEIDQQVNGEYGEIDDIKDADLEEKLRRERTATAFQYRVLRAMIKDHAIRDDLRTVTHLRDLGSYNESIKQLLVRNYRAQYGDVFETEQLNRHQEDEYWEEERWQEFLKDEWERWKMSDEFKMWLEKNGFTEDTEESTLFEHWKTSLESEDDGEIDEIVSKLEE